jgi:hypothetical protein
VYAHFMDLIEVADEVFHVNLGDAGRSECRCISGIDVKEGNTTVAWGAKRICIVDVL